MLACKAQRLKTPGQTRDHEWNYWQKQWMVRHPFKTSWKSSNLTNQSEQKFWWCVLTVDVLTVSADWYVKFMLTQRRKKSAQLPSLCWKTAFMFTLCVVRRTEHTMLMKASLLSPSHDPEVFFHFKGIFRFLRHTVDVNTSIDELYQFKYSVMI